MPMGPKPGPQEDAYFHDEDARRLEALKPKPPQPGATTPEGVEASKPKGPRGQGAA